MFSRPNRKCTDDRGSSVVPLSHVEAGHWVVAGDPRIEAMLHRAARISHGRSRWDILHLFITAVLVVSVLIGTHFFFPGLPGWMTPIAIGLISIPSLWLVARLWASQNAANLVGAVLEEGLCAACGYNLHGLSPAPDGCLLCPECGAAWKASRIVRTAPLAASAVFGDPLNVVGRQATKIVTDSQDALDDRGRAVRILDARIDSPIKHSLDDHERTRLLAVRSRLLRKTRLLRWGLSALFLTIAAVAIARQGTSTPFFVIFPIIMSVGMLVGWSGTSSEKVRKTLLEDGTCPSCAADLRVATVDEAGLAECPRCYAAWRAAWWSKEAARRATQRFAPPSGAP